MTRTIFGASRRLLTIAAAGLTTIFRGEHIDSTTTGHDYSRDVYDRAVEFADILQKEGCEVNVVSTELSLQGKYARNEHYDRFGLGRNPDRLKLPAGDPQESQDTLAAVDYERDGEGNPFTISDDEILDLTNSISEAPATPIGASAGLLPSPAKVILPKVPPNREREHPVNPMAVLPRLRPNIRKSKRSRAKTESGRSRPR